MTLGLACAMTLLTVLVPTVIQRVLDRIFSSGLGTDNYLIKGIILIALLFLGREILNCLRIRTNNKLEQKVIQNRRANEDE